MRLEVKALRENLPDSVSTYVEKRFRKLERRVHRQTIIEVTLSRERNPSIRDGHSAEAIVHTKGPNIVARESAPTYEAAVDRLVEKLERQIERQRDKRVLEPRRNAQRPVVSPPEEEPAELAGEGDGQGEAAA